MQNNSDTALYIGNLDEATTTEGLYYHFNNYNVVNIHHPYDYTKKKNKNFAFISFKTPQDASKAEREQNHKKIGVVGVNQVRLMPVLPKSSFQKTDSNVFVKNLDPSITSSEFYDFFVKFGKIQTSLLKTDKNGESLGYGYVQYVLKENAQAAIDQSNNTMFKERKMSVALFKSKGNRNSVNQKCNVYFKSVPFTSTSEEDLKELEVKMKNLFAQYGNITSMMVSLDKKVKKPFGFVCFDTHESAKQAIEQLYGKQFGEGSEPLYVSWAQTRYERQQKMNSLEEENQHTKIYVRDLNLETTEEQLQDVFSQFGVVKTLSVKTVKVGDAEKRFGMINYEDKEQATNALSQLNNPLVKSLTQNPDQQAYIKLAQSKRVRQKYVQYKKQSQQSKQMRQMMDGMGGFGMSRRAMPQMQMMMQNPMMQMMMQMMMQGGMGNMMQQFGRGQNRNQMGRRNQYQYNKRYQNQRQQYRGQRGGQYNQQMQGQNRQRPQQRQQYQNQNQMQNNQLNPNQQRKMPQPQQKMPQVQGQMGQMPPQMNQQQGRPQQVQRPPMQQNPNMMRAQQQQQQQQQQQKQQQQQQQQQQQLQGQNPNANAQSMQISRQLKQQIVQLKEKLTQFMTMEKDQQRNLLGEILYPTVMKFCRNSQNTPKVTGMLIDLEVMTVQQILELLQNETQIQQKVFDAERLIGPSNQQ